MTQEQAKQILDKVIGNVFGYQNPFTLDQALEKFAFDLRLPQQVYDVTSGQPTWASSVNPSRFITLENARKRSEIDDWMLEKRSLSGIEDIIAAWAETNVTTTERQIDSINVAQSDSIYGSENIYRSANLRKSKNVLFTEGGDELEYVVAGSRSQTSNYCIRVEDSQLCMNSFNIIWSAKVSNSFFIQDCYDVMDCMFCSHIAGKRFCIANMQFSEEDYMRLKAETIKWILTT